MSSYSFSHQFYQRWTCAPDPIRAAIIQELTDITTLLQHDTPFETFVFSNHDLDDHLDNLYENHEAEQAIAKAIAEKQRLEQEKANAEEKRKEDAKLKEAAVAQKEQQNNANALDDDVKANTDKTANLSITIENDSNKSSHNKNTNNKPMDEPSNAANDNNIKTVIDKAVSNAAIHLSLTETKLGTSQPELIRELEMHIDDYLSEQMMQISENLKSWLRAELSQHLTEPNSAVKDSEKDIAKKNIH